VKVFAIVTGTILKVEANKNGIKDDISIAVFHAVVLEPSDLAHA
jgi:hypothetical protein